MHKEYYKKVDRSMMDWGLTLPKDCVKDFEAGSKIRPGEARKVEIVWDGKVYSADLRHTRRTGYSSVHQIRWDNNKDLLKKLRKTFIQSYIILKSQKELFDMSKKKSEHFRTDLSGGQQEVLILEPINSKKIRFKVFIRIDNGWNALFERLADENVFGWLFDKNKKIFFEASISFEEGLEISFEFRPSCHLSKSLCHYTLLRYKALFDKKLFRSQ